MSSADMDLVIGVQKAFAATNRKPSRPARRSSSSSLATTVPLSRLSPIGSSELYESGVTGNDITKISYRSESEMRELVGARFTRACRTEQSKKRQSKQGEREIVSPPSRVIFEWKNTEPPVPAPERPPLRPIILPMPGSFPLIGTADLRSKRRIHPEEATPLRRSKRIAEKQLQLHTTRTRQTISQSRVTKPPSRTTRTRQTTTQSRVTKPPRVRSRRGPGYAKDKSRSAK